jgi:hypothetical protein
MYSILFFFYRLFFYFFFVCCFILLGNCASTIEFIPDPDYEYNFPDYQLKTYKEVEIFYQKPKRAIEPLGVIYIRKFDGSLNLNDSEDELKKKLFEWKIDGIWLHESKLEEVAPLLITSKNQAGMTVSYLEANKEMGKIVGTPFRYKKKYGKQTPNFQQ